MLAEGVFSDLRPDAVFGLHASAQLAVGRAAYTPGGALAAVDHFRVTIRGRQSHGAAPHLGIDPVVMAAQAITALQTIRSRTLSPLAPSVVTVGMIHGGTRFNIIPGEVALEGTVRTYDPAVQDTVERRIREILDGVTRAGGGTFELAYDRIVPVTINDPALTEHSVPSLVDALGEDQVTVADPWMAGEDFSRFANEVPGFFYMLGTLAPGTTSGDHHSPTFRAADGALPVGMRTMALHHLGLPQRPARALIRAAGAGRTRRNAVPSGVRASRHGFGLSGYRGMTGVVGVGWPTILR